MNATDDEHAATGLGLDDTRSPRRRRQVRWTAVAAAVVAAVVVWAIVGPALGRELTVGADGSSAQTVGFGVVLGVSLGASLLGLGSLALLERITGRARAIWTALAAVVLLLSLGGPISVQAPTGTKISLALLHLVVGAVLIPPLARTSPTR
jgi:hypothetical protein